MATDDANLLARFIATFAQLDELLWFDDGSPPPEMVVTVRDSNASSLPRWQPAKQCVPRSALSEIQRIGPLPDLFESLALSYCWLDVDLNVCRLIANPPTGDLKTLADSMYGDIVMNNTLLSANFVRFALAPNECYDPICFDVSRMVDGDCPVVRMNHESILSNDEIGEVTTVFDSFRSLVVAVIESTGKH